MKGNQCIFTKTIYFVTHGLKY